MRFAPYCTIFGNKQPQKGCKCRPLEINIHFVAFTHCPFLASQQTFARIDFLRQVGRLGTKWALMALFFLLKILLFLCHCHVLPQANGAEFWISSYLCSVLRTWRGAFILVLHYKENKPLSNYRNIIVKQNWVWKAIAELWANKGPPFTLREGLWMLGYTRLAFI